MVTERTGGREERGERAWRERGGEGERGVCRVARGGGDLLRYGEGMNDNDGRVNNDNSRIFWRIIF